MPGRGCLCHLQWGGFVVVIIPQHRDCGSSSSSSTHLGGSDTPQQISKHSPNTNRVGRSQVSQSLHPLQMHLGAPDAVYGYAPIATTLVNLARWQRQQGAAVCSWATTPLVFQLRGQLVAAMVWQLQSSSGNGLKTM